MIIRQENAVQVEAMKCDNVKVKGGDKVPISKFGLDTSCVVFIGPIKTYLVF